MRQLSVEDRLSIVAASLLEYSHWFPNFAQFRPSLVGLEAGVEGANHRLYMTPAEEEAEAQGRRELAAQGRGLGLGSGGMGTAAAAAAAQ